MKRCKRCNGYGRVLKYENLVRSTLGGGYHQNYDMGAPPIAYFVNCDCKVGIRLDEELVSKASTT